MRARDSQRRRAGATLVEAVALTAVAAILLLIGYPAYRGARETARVTVATSNLSQVGVALELYYRKWGCYPPPGADLAIELAPFIKDIAVLRNPLGTEDAPGRCLTDHYCQPGAGKGDRPNFYVTAFVSSDGSTAVTLRTLGIIEAIRDLNLPAGDPRAMSNTLATLWGYTASSPQSLAVPEPPIAPSPEPTGPPPTGTTEPLEPPPPTTPAEPKPPRLEGVININPGNNSDFEFELITPSGTITRDDLLASKGTLSYTGSATRVRVRPKGNGNQNGLTLDGHPLSLRNGTCYVIEGALTVSLYNNRRGQGAAMGKWFIKIEAVGATITEH